MFSLILSVQQEDMSSAFKKIREPLCTYIAHLRIFFYREANNFNKIIATYFENISRQGYCVTWQENLIILSI